MDSNSSYDFLAVQNKWNERWESLKLGASEDFSKKPKMYPLVELPYPSGAGLHMGHCWNYTLFDVYSRLFRFKGYNVLYPMGWDSFGLPTYNHAIKVGRDPHEVAADNVKVFKRQLKELGLNFDWDREIDSSSPEYYKWTQWIFIQMYEHWYDPKFKREDGGIGQARPIADLPIPADIKKAGIKVIKEYQDKFRIAYKDKKPVFWCPKCKTGLANEEVTPLNTHERCDTPVEEKELSQWMLRITAYGDRLDEDLDKVDFPHGVKVSQRDWIGRSYGIEIDYEVVGTNKKITCYTTTPVNFGASFVVVAPEFADLDMLVTEEYKGEVEKYLEEAKAKSEYDRTGSKDKTGVFTGSYVKNHLTGESLPVWVADFVLSTVGTGAVQGCPAHDVRDFEFATKYKLPIKRVVVGEDGDKSEVISVDQIVTRGMKGTMINSDFLDGMDFAEAMQETMNYFEEKGWGKRVRIFKFRDWVFSRQHYWGEPTPMIYCQKCGWSPISVHKLPITLPKLDDYKMGENGESPLERAVEWKKSICPTCGGEAEMETDVMPNWAGSNWYFLRYLDPHNKEKLVDKSIASYWMPVDIYYGGQEHVTLHLLYSRFVYKFLYDLGVVPGDEPYKKRRNHGMILGPDNRKMSKSWGNVISPDDIIQKYGADVVRMYLMFIGPFDTVAPWSENGITGVARFYKKLIKMLDKKSDGTAKIEGLSSLVQKIDNEIKSLKFNTAIAFLMEFVNKNKEAKWTDIELQAFLITIATMAPYIAEEYWNKFDFDGSVHTQEWPILVDTDADSDSVEIPVMINGKVRTKIETTKSDTEDSLIEKVSKLEISKRYMPNGYSKVVYVQGKILNIIAK